MEERAANHKPMTRNRNLDLIKIFACICVVGLHSLYYPDKRLPWAMYHMFGFAIPFFFMASGYMLLNKRSASWKYVFHKILRVLRYVLVWNLLWYGCTALKAIFVDHESWRVIGHYLWQSIRSVPLGCLFQKGAFSLFWYMGATILLYLLLPLLLKVKAMSKNGGVMDRHNRLFIVWLFALGVSIGLQAASVLLGFSIQQKVLQTLRLWCWLQYFLLGGFMPLWVRRVEEKIGIGMHALLAVAATLISVGLRLAVGIDLINAQPAEYFYDDPLFMVSVFAVFTFIMRLNLGRLAQRAVAVLVPLTLGVYATHYPLQLLVLRLVQPSGTLQSMLVFAAYIPACFGVVKLLSLIPFSKYWLEL